MMCIVEVNALNSCINQISYSTFVKQRTNWRCSTFDLIVKIRVFMRPLTYTGTEYDYEWGVLYIMVHVPLPWHIAHCTLHIAHCTVYILTHYNTRTHITDCELRLTDLDRSPNHQNMETLPAHCLL